MKMSQRTYKFLLTINSSNDEFWEYFEANPNYELQSVIDRIEELLSSDGFDCTIKPVEVIKKFT